MKTLTLCIGNSDDKLTQYEWASFCKRLSNMIDEFGCEIYFEGFTNTDSKYQSACWVLGIEDDVTENGEVQELYEEITAIRKKFKQDSAAVVLGDTEFI